MKCCIAERNWKITLSGRSRQNSWQCPFGQIQPYETIRPISSRSDNPLYRSGPELHPAIWQKSISSLRVLWYIKATNIDHVQSMKSQRRRSHDG